METSGKPTGVEANNPAGRGEEPGTPLGDGEPTGGGDRWPLLIWAVALALPLLLVATVQPGPSARAAALRVGSPPPPSVPSDVVMGVGRMVDLVEGQIPADAEVVLFGERHESDLAGLVAAGWVDRGSVDCLAAELEPRFQGRLNRMVRWAGSPGRGVPIPALTPLSRAAHRSGLRIRAVDDWSGRPERDVRSGPRWRAYVSGRDGIMAENLFDMWLDGCRRIGMVVGWGHTQRDRADSLPARLRDAGMRVHVVDIVPRKVAAPGHDAWRLVRWERYDGGDRMHWMPVMDRDARSGR